MIALISLITGIGPGGVQTVNRLVLDAARAAGIKGTVVALQDPPLADWTGDWPDAFCAEGSRIRFALSALSRRSHARGSVILATHVGLIPVGRILKKLTGGKLYLFLLGVESWRRMSPHLAWGIRGCDRLFSISKFTLEKFRQANPSLAHIPGEVCYLPSRILSGSEPERHSSGNGALRVLIVGRLWGRGLVKGQRQLIEVWPHVLAQFPGSELYVVGPGDGRSELEELARQSGVTDYVRFTGEVTDEDLDALYSSSDVYAMPSWGEGFGLVFAEAMSRGLPCIASRFDAGSEVVVDGETGMHVDPNDQGDLLRSLVTLLGDESLRRKMGETGRRRASEIFSLEAFNRRIEKILRGEEQV